ncbi:MAG: type II toxin-antitoxin system RelE/ParE family toxin [Bacteroidetes bacterium]|nr:type II toxin-antitoxin system RelE/ParE family toxin [Bacteroidota bacterium]
MGAPLKIEWTERAAADVASIHAFLLRGWGEREAERFLDDVQTFERLIAQWPRGFKRSLRNKHLRLGIIHRNTLAVYRVFQHKVVILTVFDSRSDAAH